MLAEKIKLAGRRMQLSIPPLRHLQRRLENADSNGRGLVAEDSIQVILEDLGISLSPPDLHMIRERFGNLQGSVDYEALCAALGEANEVVLSGPLASASVSASASGFAAGAGGSFQATPTVARRMRELTFDGVDVRQAFADYDFDGNGVVRSLIRPSLFPCHACTLTDPLSLSLSLFLFLNTGGGAQIHRGREAPLSSADGAATHGRHRVLY